MYNFEPYNVLLVIATNIPVLLMTAFVLKGHKYDIFHISALADMSETFILTLSSLLSSFNSSV